MSAFPCSDCAAGALHGGTPTGRVETLHDLPTYIADPPAGQEAKGIVVILPDAFGLELVNNKILADAFAQKGGFKVLLPDVFNGSAFPADALYSMDDAMEGKNGVVARIRGGFRTVSLFIPFMFWNRSSVTLPRIRDYMRAVRSSTTLPLGCAGYCWGGYYATQIACAESPHWRAEDNSDTPIADCAYVAHPSMLTIPSDIEPVKLPYSVAHATEDFNISKAKWAEMKSVLESKSDIAEWREYEGARHGFAVRGNPEVEKEKRQGEEAEEQAIDFFTRCFAKGRRNRL